MNINGMSGKVIWITGASSGIGKELVKELLSLNAIVIGSSRDAESLAQVSNNINFIAHSVDVTDSSQLHDVAELIEEQYGKIDILIANAGVCEYIDLPHFDSLVLEKVMNINYIGCIKTIEAALPLLRKSSNPYLLSMASSIAYVGLPRAQAYGPSKAAIYNLMESMKADLAGKMDVSVICPGFVESPLTDKNDFPMPLLITSEQASHYIVKGMKKRTFDINFPKRFTVIMRLLSCLPDKILYSLTARLARSKP